MKSMEYRMIAEALMCMALNIYHEARNQSVVGQVAVAEVVMNRVEDSRFPDTICEVVKQAVTYIRIQTSLYSTSASSVGACQMVRKMSSDFDSFAWREAKYHAHIVMSGRIDMACLRKVLHITTLHMSDQIGQEQKENQYWKN